MGDDRPIARVEDGVVTIRASAFDRCVRELWASLVGIEPAPDMDFMAKAAARGGKYEIAMVRHLEMEGIEFKSKQDEVELWIIPGVLRILGHTDGTINGWLDDKLRDGAEVGYECKSMSERVFDEWMAKGFLSKPGYAWQLAIYMHATKLPFLYQCVRAHPEANDLGQHGINMHVEKQDPAIDTRLITVPPKTMDEIRAKAMAVFVAWKTMDQGVDAMPECDGRFPCQFYFLHDEQPKKPGPKGTLTVDFVDGVTSTTGKVSERVEAQLQIMDPEPVIDRQANPYPLVELPDENLELPTAEAETDLLAAEYVVLDEQIKDMAKRRDEIKDEFKKGGSMTTANFEIEVEDLDGNKTFDRAKLAADHPEIKMSKYEGRGKPYKKLKSVKEREQ